ncbi:hypothetical protein JC606_07195 [Vibrio sp. IB15]|uniref:Uncharacterized protein n=1 Tax=Vibrio chagasii TaxID=170679 RepID=A0A2S7VMJ4_9VIBR|nr:hypothetical protein [Vibrio chagasii]MBJ2146151.1 hypothetical protein [Vibrio sp. IB15]PQJ63364.1 hypothetical protein BTO10_00660 [Vibrio chagasii]|tara:strand:+ start:696 stop:1373 length:678 start_codon:yes stop_codon:yes gene_type:complete
MKNHSKTEKQIHMSYESTEFNVSQSTSQVIYKRCQTALFVLAIGIIANSVLRIDFVLLNGNVGEISVTEMLQQLLLIVSSGSFVYLARKRNEVKNAAVLISAFFAVLFIREMDFWFDKIAHGAWVFPAALVAGSAIFYAVKNGKRTIDQLALILASPHMNLLVTGVMLLLVFSRLFGMGSFWHNVMGDDYVRAVKNIAEEGTELLAYCLIAFASLKTVLGITRKK